MFDADNKSVEQGEALLTLMPTQEKRKINAYYQSYEIC